jgi:uncharacterized protein (TIRG00374 family)
MRYWKFVYLLAGLALLGFVLSQTDLGDAWEHARRLGWGMAAVLAVYFFVFLADSLAWQLTFITHGFGGHWAFRLWKVRLVGSAVSATTPLATMGGEPVKVVVLKKRYGIGYRESVASLVLARTTTVITLVIFLTMGFLLMLDQPRLATTYKTSAGLGLALLALGIGLFFLIQRFKVSSLTGRWILRSRLSARIERILGHVGDMEERLIRFYTRHRGRFAAALGLTLTSWLLGTVELYVTLWLLGNPVSFTDAWIIEAVTQLVRAATFVIPASIGAQEGAFVLIVGAITGQPALGLAVALVRRAREIVWILAGFALGWRYAFRSKMVAAALADAAEAASGEGERD